ncbi:MAG: ubiquinone/menaquinone biosynthesis methyltransferase [Alphaproteobacteria bacterium]|nr:ubiquinone/menaquinone biosynthesis methyltransferase [Alphaproteobacteria bacterium]
MAGTSREQQEPGARRADFGFRRVPAEEHPSLVRGVFDSVAGRYDLMNDLMSGGLHRLWKQALIDWLAPRDGLVLADIAAGTGDIAIRALERVTRRGGAAEAILCDPNESMLRIARDRCIDAGMVRGPRIVCCAAEALALPDRVAGACTISFGLRNATDRPAALAEMRRILAPGGHFLCLEFSPAVLPALAPLYDAYSYNVLPWLGEHVADDRDSYRYLAESIRRFPAPGALAGEMREAGFGNVHWRAMSAGIVALHSGWRT